MADEPESQIDRESKRKKILEIFELKQSTWLKGYDGFEGYLGESFCEDYLQMKKARPGTKDIDGWICDQTVQVKFKWIVKNFPQDRFITVNSELNFCYLIVTCAEYGGEKVFLFGIWGKDEVSRVRKPKGRVYLNDLLQIAQSGTISGKEMSLPPELKWSP